VRYLFGPVTKSFADQCLHQARTDKRCLAFNSEGDVDVTIGFGDTWDAISKRLSADWQPDFLALYLPYANIPLSLWDAPVPRVALASDWNLLWHSHRRWLPGAAAVLADAMGAEIINAAAPMAMTLWESFNTLARCSSITSLFFELVVLHLARKLCVL